MAESTLTENSSATDGLEFGQLRDDGIAMLQRLCGEHWTDYNLHDPGVTTLEQLVYGLTDLAYRTGFDMADYLTGPDGDIAWHALSLYAPEAILSTEAVTVDDYRRLIYDALPEVGEIWIWPAAHGLVSIDVMRAPEVTTPRAVTLEQSVRLVYAAHRTLCEDLVQVRMVAPRPYHLEGVIDTCGERDRAEILAQIYFNCGEYLSSGMKVRRLSDAAASGSPPDQLFDGPAMAHGHVTARGWASEVRFVTVSELVGQIQKIEGVSRVRMLTLLDEDLAPCTEMRCDSRDGDYPTLPFPEGEHMVRRLALQPVQGTEYGVLEQVLPVGGQRAADHQLYQEAYLELHKLRFERHAFRTETARSHECFPMPVGRYRELHGYYSIQNEFPEVYGINAYGLPNDVSEERKAQARQLKAFLYPCEQLMANYLQNLQDLPVLFSPHTDATQPTYFSQYLSNDNLPRIEELYMPQADAVPHALGEVLRRHDDHADRKSRVYDYLLALYGESFPQTALRRFNQYHRADTEAWLLDAKRRLLTALEELSSARARAFNYFKQSGTIGNISPLQRRLSVLLGFDGRVRECRLALSWDGQPLTLAGDPLQEDADASWRAIPALPESDQGRHPLPQLPAPPGELSESLFRAGAVLSSYRMHAGDSGTILYCGAGSRYQRIGTFATPLAAIRAAHAAVAALQDLNDRGEGIHLVEHILLRPLSGEVTEDFHPSRVSVVLPGYTVRCADSAFRNFVEETVRANCPAHVHAQFRWLGPASMRRFEDLLQAWQDELREYHLRGAVGTGDAAQVLQNSAAALAQFLLAHEEEQ